MSYTIEFEVIGIIKRDEETGEVQLTYKHPSTIYNSQVFLKVPLFELNQYKFGDKFRMERVSDPPGFVPEVDDPDTVYGVKR